MEIASDGYSVSRSDIIPATEKGQPAKQHSTTLPD